MRGFFFREIAQFRASTHPLHNNIEMDVDSDSDTAGSYKDEDDWAMLIDATTKQQHGFQLIFQQILHMEAEEGEADEEQQTFDEMDDGLTERERRHRHKSSPRRKRRVFNHSRAYKCIMQDYLGLNPLFNDGGFEMMFHISRTRFQRIMEDVGALNEPYYHTELMIRNRLVCCLLAKLMLPLKCIAYGNPPHAF